MCNSEKTTICRVPGRPVRVTLGPFLGIYAVFNDSAINFPPTDARRDTWGAVWPYMPAVCRQHMPDWTADAREQMLAGQMPSVLPKWVLGLPEKLPDVGFGDSFRLGS